MPPRQPAFSLSPDDRVQCKIGLSWPGLDYNRIGGTGTSVETFEKLHCGPTDDSALLVHTNYIVGFSETTYSHDMGFPAIHSIWKTMANCDQCSNMWYQGAQVADLVFYAF